MGNKISELPSYIKEIALQRQRDCRFDGYDKKTDVLLDAFDWGDTIEGSDIWDEVDEGNYKPFQEFHSNLTKKEFDKLPQATEEEKRENKY